MNQMILTAVLLGALLLAGTMDKQDEKLMESDYCDQVEQGIWPNYKNINCEGENNAN